MTKVIIAVFDGLQPAQIDSSVCPNIHQLSQDGCFFESHHPVFPSVTRINAASMVTGVNPGSHGLPGNTFVARDFDPGRVLSAMEPELAAIASSGLPVLYTPTLQEILSTVGLEYMSIGVGTSGNAYAHNPRGEEFGGATIHPDFSIPSSLHASLLGSFGEWPAESIPNTDRYVHAMDIFMDFVLEEKNPDVALIWSSEPDKSQHAFGVGSLESCAALSQADAQFGRLLGYLETSPNHKNADVLVLSDHGYSTIIGTVDIEKEMKRSGFPVGPGPEGVLVASNGGSALIYVGGSNRDLADRIVSWLISNEWCGAVLASERLGDIEGTIPASVISYDGPRCPDITVSFKWTSEMNVERFAGHVYSTGGAAGLGQHGSMSRHEMNNTLLCRGPSFRKGERILSPSGNIDVMPTVLDLLGVAVPESIDGRVLEEAFSDFEGEIVSETREYVATRKTEKHTYEQSIVVSRVDNSIYLDEGNSSVQIVQI